jgi:hypothetical protein
VVTHDGGIALLFGTLVRAYDARGGRALESAGASDLAAHGNVVSWTAAGIPRSAVLVGHPGSTGFVHPSSALEHSRDCARSPRPSSRIGASTRPTCQWRLGTATSGGCRARVWPAPPRLARVPCLLPLSRGRSGATAGRRRCSFRVVGAARNRDAARLTTVVRSC